MIFNSASLELRDLNFPLLQELSTKKDASTWDIMDLLRLDDAVAETLGMTDLQPDASQLMVPVHHKQDKVIIGSQALSSCLDILPGSGEKMERNLMNVSRFVRAHCIWLDLSLRWEASACLFRRMTATVPYAMKNGCFSVNLNFESLYGEPIGPNVWRCHISHTNLEWICPVTVSPLSDMISPWEAKTADDVIPYELSYLVAVMLRQPLLDPFGSVDHGNTLAALRRTALAFFYPPEGYFCQFFHKHLFVKMREACGDAILLRARFLDFTLRVSDLPQPTTLDEAVSVQRPGREGLQNNTGILPPHLSVIKTALIASFAAAKYMINSSRSLGAVLKKGNDFSADFDKNLFKLANFPFIFLQTSLCTRDGKLRSRQLYLKTCFQPVGAYIGSLRNIPPAFRKCTSWVQFMFIFKGFDVSVMSLG
ncbi:hypothetical protein Tco_0397117 [Tanacetum coccineum]